MSARLISIATRTAAKRHNCIWCWQLIERGERHTHEVSASDDGLHNHRWHPECRVAMIAESKEEGGPIEWTPGRERPTA